MMCVLASRSEPLAWPVAALALWGQGSRRRGSRPSGSGGEAGGSLEWRRGSTWRTGAVRWPQGRRPRACGPDAAATGGVLTCMSVSRSLAAGWRPARRCPGRVMVSLTGQHPGRQRQIAAQAGNLARCGIGSLRAGPAGQAGWQFCCLTWGRGAQADHRGVFQRRQPAAAGDEHRVPGGARKQRADLLMSGRVIEHQKDLPACHIVTSPRRSGLPYSGRDLLGAGSSCQRQCRQRIGGSTGCPGSPTCSGSFGLTRDGSCKRSPGLGLWPTGRCCA